MVSQSSDSMHGHAGEAHVSDSTCSLRALALTRQSSTKSAMVSVIVGEAKDLIVGIAAPKLSQAELDLDMQDHSHAAFHCDVLMRFHQPCEAMQSASSLESAPWCDSRCENYHFHSLWDKEYRCFDYPPALGGTRGYGWRTTVHREARGIGDELQ